MLSSILPAKAAAAAVAAIAAVGGTAAAAFTGNLPAPAQQFAHNTIGAPSPQSSASPGSQASPAGPDATGPAAFGLCTAYTHAKAHGSVSQKSVAFRNLAAAAGGADKIAAYCASVPHPGSSHAGQPAAAPSHSHPAGAPASAPTSHATGMPSSLPTSHATGAASTTHPTGKPTAVPTSH